MSVLAFDECRLQSENRINYSFFEDLPLKLQSCAVSDSWNLNDWQSQCRLTFVLKIS